MEAVSSFENIPLLSQPRSSHKSYVKDPNPEDQRHDDKPPGDDAHSDNPRYYAENGRVTGNSRAVSWAYLAALVSVVTVSVSLPCVQVLDGVVPEFELNAWRFLAQVLLVLPVVIAKKNGCSKVVRVPISYLPQLIVIFVLYIAFNLTYYSAALYLPVGTLDGLNNAVVIAVNVLVSLCVRADRRLHLYLSAVVSVLGIMMLVQPGFMFSGGETLGKSTNWSSPCAATSFLQIPRVNSSLYTTSDINQNQPYIITTSISMDKTSTSESSPSAWLGYLLIAISGVCSAGAFHVMHRTDIAPTTLALWVGVVGVLGSVVPMAIWETPTFPCSALCVVILFVHAFGVGQSSVVTPYVLRYVSPSVLALINSLHLVFLFLFQFTFLSEIQPGRGNVLEAVGAVLCVVGAMIAPIWHVMEQYCCPATTHQREEEKTLLAQDYEGLRDKTDRVHGH